MAGTSLIIPLMFRPFLAQALRLLQHFYLSTGDRLPQIPLNTAGRSGPPSSYFLEKPCLEHFMRSITLQVLLSLILFSGFPPSKYGWQKSCFIAWLVSSPKLGTNTLSSGVN